jgi:hypothetical protein
LKAKAEATQFKISWEFIDQADGSSQNNIFYALLSNYVFYFILAVIIPFVFKPAEKCSTMASILVYAAYGG